MTGTASGTEDIERFVRERAGARVAMLEELVAIPSVAGRDSATLRSCAEAAAALLDEAGADATELLEVPGAPPAVWADIPGPSGAPTVLLYTHYDVQPVGDPARWTSPPFEPTRRDGRLFGRGAADNKAAIVVHADTIRAWKACRSGPPVNLRVLIEGEEELGSPHLRGLIDLHRDRLRCDVAVVPDAANWQRGWPALTTSTRGLAEVTVTVRTLRRPLHSGVWGGAARDAIAVLSGMLASLYDSDGRVVVPDFLRGAPAPTAQQLQDWGRLEADDASLRAEAGLVAAAGWVPDDAPLVARRWIRPSISVVGMDVPSVADAANQLVDQARAKLSIRLAPGQEPTQVMAAVVEHLRRQATDVEVDVEADVRAPGWQVDASGPAADAARRAMAAAYGREPAIIGGGGTIALVPQLDAALGATCLLTGLGDPAMNAHAEDESMPLDDLTHATVAEALLLGELADGAVHATS